MHKRKRPSTRQDTRKHRPKLPDPALDSLDTLIKSTFRGLYPKGSRLLERVRSKIDVLSPDAKALVLEPLIQAKIQTLSPDERADFEVSPADREELINDYWLNETIYPRLEWERIRAVLHNASRIPGSTAASAIEVLENMKDPSYLPTLEEARSARLYNDEDWLDFCRAQESQLYEIFNQEYVAALASYIVERAREYGATPEKPMTVLEVGAGEGKLAHFLAQECERLAPGLVKIIASTSATTIWSLTKPRYPVEIADYADALEQHNPDIVICSWMPNEIDWTADFRKTTSVKEYILIGETDEGCCGDHFETWGGAFWGKPEPDAPYLLDGFSRHDMDDLSQYQSSRFGSVYFEDKCGEAVQKYNERSKTVSFRRD